MFSLMARLLWLCMQLWHPIHCTVAAEMREHLCVCVWAPLSCYLSIQAVLSGVCWRWSGTCRSGWPNRESTHHWSSSKGHDSQGSSDTEATREDSCYCCCSAGELAVSMIGLHANLIWSSLLARGRLYACKARSLGHGCGTI